MLNSLLICLLFENVFASDYWTTIAKEANVMLKSTDFLKVLKEWPSTYTYPKSSYVTNQTFDVFATNWNPMKTAFREQSVNICGYLKREFIWIWVHQSITNKSVLTTKIT